MCDIVKENQYKWMGIGAIRTTQDSFSYFNSESQNPKDEQQ